MIYLFIDNYDKFAKYRPGGIQFFATFAEFAFFQNINLSLFI